MGSTNITMQCGDKGSDIKQTFDETHGPWVRNNTTQKLWNKRSKKNYNQRISVTLRTVQRRGQCVKAELMRARIP